MVARLITLLTDFGLQDGYVGVLKGTIAQINPDAKVIDLTHAIAPHNILAARFNLMNAYPYFPAETIHVAVVDPGVGSARRSIAIQLEDGFLVGPDNGVFSGVLQMRSPSEQSSSEQSSSEQSSSEQSPIKVVALTNREYWRVQQPSCTFHGRDIFAPVAAHLSRGISIDALGDVIAPTTLSTTRIAPYIVTSNGFSGQIQYIDRFGNLISTIPNSVIQSEKWSVTLESQIGSDLNSLINSPVSSSVSLPIIPGCLTYSDVRSGEALALQGSHGWIEVAVNQGNAQIQFGVDWAASIRVTL